MKSGFILSEKHVNFLSEYRLVNTIVVKSGFGVFSYCRHLDEYRDEIKQYQKQLLIDDRLKVLYRYINLLNSDEDPEHVTEMLVNQVEFMKECKLYYQYLLDDNNIVNNELVNNLFEKTYYDSESLRIQVKNKIKASMVCGELIIFDYIIKNGEYDVNLTPQITAKVRFLNAVKNVIQFVSELSDKRIDMYYNMYRLYF